MLSLSTEPNPASLEQLFTECFRLSDSFSLTEGPCGSTKAKSLLHLLEPYLVGTIETQHWFCYYVPKGYEKRVHIFRSCDESKKILMDSYESLFLNGNSKLEIAEDVCFFSKRKLFMGTVTHENICYVYPPNDESQLSFQRILTWETTDDDKREQIIYEI